MLGFGAAKRERAGFALYTATVTAARDPYYFATLGVPDTLDGRFDLIALMAAILIRRLRHLPKPGAALAQAVFDAMFSDMDFNLRELGVGDVAVPKRMRDMWEAFHGRAKAYEEALDAPPKTSAESDPLITAITRNVWHGNAPANSAAHLAHCARAHEAALATQTLADFSAGRVNFASIPAIAA